MHKAEVSRVTNPPDSLEQLLPKALPDEANRGFLKAG
jgi:hypothetical protein